MEKKMFKKSPEDLEQYLHFRKRAFKVKPKVSHITFTGILLLYMLSIFNLSVYVILL